MKHAIRKHLGDFLAILGLFVLSIGVAGYILSHERLRFPFISAKPFTVTLLAGSYRGEWHNIGNRRTAAADPVTVMSDGNCQFIAPFAEAGQVVLYLKRVGGKDI